MTSHAVNISELRDRALKAIEFGQSQSEDISESYTDGQIVKVVEELRLYQTELEIQNSELTNAQSKIALMLEKYRALFDNLPLPAIVVDSQGFIADANVTACEFLHLSRNSALLRRSVVQFFDVDSRIHLYPFLRNTSNHAPQVIKNLIVKTGPEKAILCDIHIIHLQDESNPEGRSLFVFVDKTAENALLMESQKNQAFLRNGSDGIHILNTEGEVIEASDSFCFMLGYRRSEVIGMNVSQWDSNFTRGELPDIILQQYENGVRSQFETLHKRKDGTTIDVEISGYPLQLDGKPLMFYSSRDITERKQSEKALGESEQRFRSLVEGAPEGIYVQMHECFAYVNDTLLPLLGATSKEQLLGQPIYKRIHPDSRDKVAERLCKFSENNLTNRPSEETYQRLDGKPVPVEISAVPMQFDNDKGTLVFVRDITERKRAEEVLRESESRFRNMADTAPVLIWISGTDKLCTWFNKGWLDFTGRILEQEIGNGWWEGVHPEDILRCLNTYETAFDVRNDFSMEYRLRNASGEYRWVLDHGVPRFDDGGNFFGYIGSCIDINDRHDTEAKIQHMAFHDQLTKLPNRRLLNDRLRQTISASKRNGRYAALMLLDLDNFKPLNDAYGHAAGDLLLTEVAKRLISCVREADTVARFGGDEFVVLLGELTEDREESAQHAEKIARKILGEVSIPYSLQIQNDSVSEIQNIEHQCTASIGVSVIKGAETSAKDALMWADQAMYQAKESGRNALRFYQPVPDVKLV